MPKSNARRNNNKVRQTVNKMAKLAISQPMVKKMVKTALQKSGSTVGGMVGGSFGAPITGARVGSMLGARISKLIGSGDYVATGLTSHNTLIKNNVPASISFSDRTIRIAHREFIGDVITGSVAGNFNSVQRVVNANYSSTFPYLSGIATQFEKYRFKGLVFEFVSTTTPYAAAGAGVGTVVMACQFNTASPDFVSKTQMENVENAISVRMDQNALYGVECKDQVQNWYYTRHIGATSITTGSVSNIYDLCDFSIATVGGSAAANTPVGELWVTYDVELTGPRLPDARYGYFHAKGTSGTAALPLGSNRTIKQYGICAPITMTGSGISFNNAVVGDIFQIQYFSAGGTTNVSTSALILPGVNPTLEYVVIDGSSTNAMRCPTSTVSTNTVSFVCYVRLLRNNAIIDFPSDWALPTTNVVDVWITPVAFSVADSNL